MTSLTMPMPAATRTLLERCDAELLAAQFSSDPADRFIHAHYAALRAAGAILESMGRSHVRGRSANVWHLLSTYVPRMIPWADQFATSARLRAALDSGRFDLIDSERADALLAAAEDFRDLAETEIASPRVTGASEGLQAS